MEARELLAIVWLWHAFWLILLTLAIGQAAHRITGSPFQWPVPGRWLLTFLFIMFTIMVGDVARIIFTHNILDNQLREVPWTQPLLRIIPIPIEPWVFWRQWTRGLTNDKE